MSRHRARSKRVVIVGLGNIGSFLVQLVGLIPIIREVVLIDHDSYEKKNSLSQLIHPQDIGRPKVQVQAEGLWKLNPSLRVRAVHDAVENVPLGLLRGDAILGCVDSRRTRIWLNQVSWRLRVPWIDSGVRANGARLARVNVYRPGPAQPCYECQLQSQDYATMEQRHLCGGVMAVSPTNGSASLGSMAASLQAVEIEKLLTATPRETRGGLQVIVDASAHQLHRALDRRNQHCRFDHRTWRITKLGRGPDAVALRSLLKNGARLRVEGQPFVRELCCPGCGNVRRTLRLLGRRRPSERACAHCGRELIPIASAVLDGLELTQLPSPRRDRPLSQFGFKPLDVFTLTSPGGERHFEFGGDRA